MQLLLFLNGLAGRYPLLDGCAKIFYIGAVPLLAALFFAHLLLISRAEKSQKIRLAVAVGLSLGFLAIIGMGIEWLARAHHLGTLSPRPWMTRRIEWLVVEPQDNSFPCYEVGIAAIFATGLWFSHRKWGIAGAVLTALFGLTRLYCGNNFLADVAIGALLGAGLCAAFGALCVPEPPFERAAIRNWAMASAVVALGLGGSYVAFAQSPRFAAKMPLLWSSPATAASQSLPDSDRVTRAARGSISEGEGTIEGGASTDAEPSAEALALSKRSHLFLPAVEEYLRGKLSPRARPFRLLDVEVAPVKAGDRPYRCAAIRFEIARNVPDLRRQTVEVAATLVKAAFHADSLLQNVDVTAILRGDGAQIDGSALRFAGDEVPVFTASIARQNLHVAAPRWANDPKLGGGLWLLTRSLLYINDKILPATAPAMPPKPAPVAQPAPILKPKPAINSAPILPPKPAPRLSPTSKLAPLLGSAPSKTPARPAFVPLKPRPVSSQKPSTVRPNPTALPAKPTPRPTANTRAAVPKPMVGQ